MTSRQQRESRRGNALRLGVVPMLIALVGIPVLVLGGLIVQDLRESGRERSATQEIVPIAETRLSAIRLQAALSDERTWAIAALGVDRYGVDPDVVGELVGVDIIDRYEQSTTTTDALTDRWPSIASALAATRSERQDLSDLDLAAEYQAMMDEVDAAGQDAAHRLEKLATPLPSGDALLQALDFTEAAADTQLSVNGMFVSSIAARFVESTGEPEQELQALIQNRRAYIAATDAPERIGPQRRAGRALDSDHFGSC